MRRVAVKGDLPTQVCVLPSNGAVDPAAPATREGARVAGDGGDAGLASELRIGAFVGGTTRTRPSSPSRQTRMDGEEATKASGRLYDGDARAPLDGT